MTCVLGLDLSLRRTAAVIIPANWEHEWTRLHWLVPTSGATPSTPREAMLRQLGITSQLVAFAARQFVTDVFVEAHAFHQGAGSFALERAELVGIVKAAFFGDGLTVTPIVASSARKLLFGKLPRKDAKLHAFARIQQMGCPAGWKDDEADAFVVANAGRSSLGLSALSMGDA